MMLMLTLDDAVAVCMRFLHETTYFDDMTKEEYESMPEFIRGEFEQKCWISSDREPAERLYDLIFDINPAEICAQIEAGNLKKWCEIIQVEMNLAMVRLPSAQPERKKGEWIIKDNPGTGWYRVTCSECGEDVTSVIPMIGFFPNAKALWDFCPDCGADMRGEEDAEIH